MCDKKNYYGIDIHFAINIYIFMQLSLNFEIYNGMILLWTLIKIFIVADFHKYTVKSVTDHII